MTSEEFWSELILRRATALESALHASIDSIVNHALLPGCPQSSGLQVAVHVWQLPAIHMDPPGAGKQLDLVNGQVSQPTKHTRTPLDLCLATQGKRNLFALAGAHKQCHQALQLIPQLTTHPPPPSGVAFNALNVCQRTTKTDPWVIITTHPKTKTPVQNPLRPPVKRPLHLPTQTSMGLKTHRVSSEDLCLDIVGIDLQSTPLLTS